MLRLVKHAMPVPVPGVEPARWALSGQGREDARRFGPRLAAFGPSRIVSSREPKASGTAEVLAEALGIPFAHAPGLHEHLRPREPFVDRTRFERSIRALFETPRDRVYGDESATQALERFAAAVDAACGDGPGCRVVVAHGTVISLFVARHTGTDGFDLWKRLTLPSCVVLDPDTAILVDILTA